MEDEKIKKLTKRNKIKSIIIVILMILLCASIATNVPKVRKAIKQTVVNLTGDEEIYNSKYKLNLRSVYGDLEAYHPKILQFNDKWNGYLYWLTYTPYPDSDEQKENPHVVASNDLINWETPKGLQNPLDDVIGDEYKQYNSDSHLVYNDDLNRLECYWRYVDDIRNTVTIYRRHTLDGVNWTEKETVAYSSNRKQKDYVAPAIIYEEGKYKIWYVDSGLIVKYAEAKIDDENWNTLKTIDLEYPKSLEPWHLDIVKTDKGYEMLMMAFENWDKRGLASLYHSYSKDNEQWSKCTEIIKPSTNSKYWDNRGIYRSSMIKKDGIYLVYYSASDINNIKGIGIMYGKDINNLKRVDIDYTNDKDAAKKFEDLLQKEK